MGFSTFHSAAQKRIIAVVVLLGLTGLLVVGWWHRDLIADTYYSWRFRSRLVAPPQGEIAYSNWEDVGKVEYRVVNDRKAETKVCYKILWQGEQAAKYYREVEFDKCFTQKGKLVLVKGRSLGQYSADMENSEYGFHASLSFYYLATEDPDYLIHEVRSGSAINLTNVPEYLNLKDDGKLEQYEIVPTHEEINPGDIPNITDPIFAGDWEEESRMTYTCGW